ncbi:MAG TPA: hypothetical protein VFP47_11475, partial [Pyrinomonadaceae bacterium]|nr:hypothetical protein [Pyrinomonadaceae bacterium]
MSRKSAVKTSERVPANKRKSVVSKGQSAQSVETASTVDSTDFTHLLSATHSDPHRVLGPHLSDAGLIIRVFRPDAELVEVAIGKKLAQPMSKTHPAGLFEVLLPGLTTVPSYRLVVHHSDDRQEKIRDPYSFLPTLGELDLHLFAEGRHEAIYKKLGSHVKKIGNVRGVSFAVWAPQAEGVSVVGNFNNWDGRQHQMRSLGGSG